ALADFQAAMAGGAISADTCYKAASFGAELLRDSKDPVDPQLDSLVLELIRKAIERGKSRQELERCPKVGEWAKRLPADVGLVPAPRMQIIEGLVDPL